MSAVDVGRLLNVLAMEMHLRNGSDETVAVLPH